MHKVVLVFLIAFTSQVFAKQGLGASSEDINREEQHIRVGCGYAFEVWDYISERMNDNTARVIPSVADESIRYFVQCSNGNWLIVVEWKRNQDGEDNTDSTACIMDRGGKGSEAAALAHPVKEYPSGFISGRISVPVSKPQHTSKSLL